MQEIFKDDQLMLKLNVVHKLRKWLHNHKEERFYASWLHRRIGGGLNKAEFDWCVKMLEVSGCCTVTIGDKGGAVITLKESDNLPTYSPEEVIAHAMQCPPITEELLMGPKK